MINNNGNIHWKINVPNTGTGISFVDLGYGQILKSNERKIKATHTLKIINVLNDGSQITINTIDTGLGSVYKAEFRTIENKHFLYGFYSPEGIINADGLFVAEIAPSGELINIRKAPISNLDIQKNISTESNKELQKCIAQNTSYLFNFDLKIFSLTMTIHLQVLLKNIFTPCKQMGIHFLIFMKCKRYFWLNSRKVNLQKF